MRAPVRKFIYDGPGPFPSTSKAAVATIMMGMTAEIKKKTVSVSQFGALNKEDQRLHGLEEQRLNCLRCFGRLQLN